MTRLLFATLGILTLVYSTAFGFPSKRHESGGRVAQAKTILRLHRLLNESGSYSDPNALLVAKIDRHALVSRHIVEITKFDGESPMQVGNGHFAFGMDITGLQTFAAFNTMSDWSWHSDPLPDGVRIEDYQGDFWDTHGRPVRYPMPDPKHPAISAWLAGNPHRINLGRLGMVLKKRDGSPPTVNDLIKPKQKLDLWNGLVTSQFEFEGEPVSVITACDPRTDAIAVQIKSTLVKEGRLAVFLDCPGDNNLQFANYVGDSNNLGLLDTLPMIRSNRADFVRPLDKDTYYMSLAWKGDATLQRPAPVTAQIEIIKAEYGAKDTWVDVMERTRGVIHNGRFVLHVDNKLAPDPILGTVKHLRVTYRINGRQETKDAVENDDLIIDPNADRRRFTLQPNGKTDELSFVCAYSPKPIKGDLPSAEATVAANKKSWPNYWQSGGAIDLSGSADPRWMELERRIVLSQYLMAVNEAGSTPPQESGLENNGWFGRFHMEMYWWHAVHWALWNHWPELNRSLGIYEKLLPNAKKLAKSEGYEGARWPKCIGPDGREWPHVIHGLLIWQQPHPIFFAELDYRAHPTEATLEKWYPVVEATADFLSTYAFWDEKTKRYVLGPPIMLVSENTEPKTTQNPTFELGYWRFGLRTAQEWRHRLGLPDKEAWDKVLKGLSPLPVQEGLYVLHEGVKDMWTKWNFEHPALTGVFGLLPGDGVDKSTMQRTFDKVTSTWDFNHTWGWDFPMLAMCAARLGETDRAMDLLINPYPGFQFDVHGLATGGPYPYFPSNGGLLYAVAMMAAGWDGGPKTPAPGFPSNGKWKVRWENLSVAP